MWGFPWSVTLETNNTCNLHCPECTTGTGELPGEKGFVTLPEIQTIIQQIPDTVFYVNLYFLGEPLLHPEIHQIIQWLKKRKIYVSLSTNAQLLDERKARQLVASGLDRLIISLDGYDQPSYSQYRKAGDFNQVTTAVSNILNARNIENSPQPFVVLQTLLLKSTENHLTEMKKLGLALGADKHEFKTAWFDTRNRNPFLVPEKEQFSRYQKDETGRLTIKKTLSGRCFRMWTSAVITWQGKVLPCCFDRKGAFILGDIIKKPLREIWRGSAYMSFRKKIITGRNNLDMCSNCTEGISGIKRS